MGKAFTKFRGGWVTPEGELIDSGFGEHDLSAREIIQGRYPVMYDRLRGYDYKQEISRRDFLVNKNWVLLTGNPYPAMGITRHIFIVCKTAELVTPQQHELIEKMKNDEVRFSGFVTVDDT